MPDPASPIRIAVTGAAGRMGRMLITLIAGRDDCTLRAAVERDGMAKMGTDAGELAALGPAGVPVVSDLASVIGTVDVVIDFTTPAATCAHARIAAAAGCAIVVGTTGLDDSQHKLLDEVGASVPVVYEPNFSIGMHLMLQLLPQVAAAFGDDADIEVVEMHHRHKTDAPSGTALRMGEVLTSALGRDLKMNAVHGRSGHTGVRNRRTIGFHAMRGGDVIGDHTVVFAAEGERLELTHRASDRMVFAAGALRAALWAPGRPAGRYDLNDVLALS